MVTLCVLDIGSGAEAELIRQCIAQSRPRVFHLSEHADLSDFVLVVGITEANLYEQLRSFSVPYGSVDRCYVYSELDNPPLLLHGIGPSYPQWKAFGRRFTGFHFPLHEALHANSPPSDLLSSQRAHFLSFVGQNSSLVRRKILANCWTDRCQIIDTSNKYHHFDGLVSPGRSEFQRLYWQTTINSQFSLCPRGHGASAIRIYESMRVGAIPVILSDAWIPPPGIQWNQCSVRLKECDAVKAERILSDYSHRASEMGSNARQVWIDCFSPERFSQRLLDSLIHIQESQCLDESLCFRLQPLLYLIEAAHHIRIQAAVRLRRSIRFAFDAFSALTRSW